MRVSIRWGVTDRNTSSAVSFGLLGSLLKETLHPVLLGCRRKRRSGGQWKRLVNIICFIDLTVKACRLSFMLLWLAPLKIQQLQIKNDFLKNLSVFSFFISCLAAQVFACNTVKTFHHLYELPRRKNYVHLFSPSQRDQWHWTRRDCSIEQQWSSLMQGLINVLRGSLNERKNGSKMFQHA